MVPLALGTQTGGSVIRPGAYCGVPAFKPTHGTVSTEGIKLFSRTLDTVGWYARSVADISLLARVLEITDQPIPEPPAARSLRIGICRTPYWDRALPATRAAIEELSRRLRAAGAQLDDLDVGAPFARVNDLKETVMRAEGRFAFLNLQRAHPGLVSPGIRARMQRIPDARLCAALDEAARCARFSMRSRRASTRCSPRAPPGKRRPASPPPGSHFQRALDPAARAVHHPAGPDRPRRAAGRRAAGRSPLRRSRIAGRGRNGGGAAALEGQLGGFVLPGWAAAFARRAGFGPLRLLAIAARQPSIVRAARRSNTSCRFAAFPPGMASRMPRFSSIVSGIRPRISSNTETDEYCHTWSQRSWMCWRRNAFGRARTGGCRKPGS